MAISDLWDHNRTTTRPQTAQEQVWTGLGLNYAATQDQGRGAPADLSPEQQAYLAGIKNFTGSPEQMAQLQNWQAQQAAIGSNRAAEQAQAQWQDPGAMAAGASPNRLGTSADGRHTVAYAATPDRLADEAFRLQGFDQQAQGYRQAGSDIGRFASQVGQRGDLANSQQSRDLLLSNLTNEGPSPAELQLKAGQESANRQALALARSGRGMGGAGALRMAMQQGQEGMGAANQQAAILRAQESQQRTGQLAALSQMDRASLAGADQTYLAGRQGQLGAMGALTGLTQAQQGARADQAKTQLAADTGVNVQNASFSNYRDPPKDNSGAIAGAIASGLGAAATLASDERIKTDVTPLDGGFDANAYQRAMGGAGAMQGASLSGPTGAAAPPAEPGALSRLASGMGGIADPLAQGIAADANAYNASYRPPPALLYNPLQLSDEDSKQEIKRLKNKLFDYEQADFREFHKEGLAEYNAREGRRMNKDGMGASQGAASALARGAVPSEANLATSVFEQTPGYSYRYKEGTGEDPTKTHLGPMAQDLEKTAAADTVKTGPGGQKVVDTGRLALVNAAATGDIARRLRMLEKDYTGDKFGRDEVTAARRPILSQVGR